MTWDEADALLWAIETAIEAEGEWFEEHSPSDYGAGWFERAMEIRLKLERLVLLLRNEAAWRDPQRVERIAADAEELAGAILAKCARDAARGVVTRRLERAANESEVA
jgi:hypothetical protein